MFPNNFVRGCLFLHIVHIVVAASNVLVTDLGDGPANTSACLIASSECNLRSAWEYCAALGEDCIVTLPSSTSITLDATYGPLYLQESSMLKIEGNNATVFGSGKSSPPPVVFNDSPDFPLHTGTLEDTLFATRNTAEGCTVGCPGDLLKFSACDDDAIGDTYFRLFRNDTEIIDNDDYCGYISQLTYEVPLHAGCDTYCLHVGCYDLYTCSANVTLAHVTIRDSADFRFITYNQSDVNSSIFPSLHLHNLTISQFHGAQHGGAIFSAGNANLTLEDVHFVNTSALFSGGAIYIQDNSKSTSITKCTFTDIAVSGFENIGESGGAIMISHNVQGVEISNSSYIRCAAHDSSGGAIALGTETSSIQLDNLLFSNCTSDVIGGGIYIGASNFDISIANSVFVDCFAAKSGGGVALDSFNMNVNITTTEFTRCVSSMFDGGGISVNVGNTNIIVSRNAFIECSTYRSGGGIFFYLMNYDIVVESCMFMSCVSTFTGGSVGIIALNDNIHLRDTIITSSRAGFSGGGLTLYASNVNTSLSNVTFVDNHVDGDGGAIYIRSTMQATYFYNCTIAHTTAGARGGGIYIGIANLDTVFDQLIALDTQASFEGGAVFANTGNVRLQILNSIISNSTADSGGGVYLYSRNDNFIMNHCHISACVASVGAGVAISKENADGHITQSSFKTNKASYLGGGVYCASMNHRLVIAGCDMYHNQAQTGGAIYIGDDHENLLISDYASWLHVQVVESEHPYQADRGTNIFTKHVYNIDCAEFIILFDRLTQVGAQEVLYIYDSPSKNEIYFVGDKSNLWPGVNLVALRVPGPEVYVEFQGPSLDAIFAPTSYSMNIYGVKMYVIPVLDTSIPVGLMNNSATGNGGALYIGYSSTFPVLLQLNITNNTASNGGGVFIRNAVAGLVVQQVSMKQNRANANGGGIMFSTANYGATIKNCLWQANVAGGSGGAVYVKADNGDGHLVVHNEILFDEVLFEANQADYGGAVGADSANVIAIKHSTLQSNVANHDGGALFLVADNSLDIQEVVAVANVAQRNGGAILAVNRNSIYASGVNISSNMATNGIGGGIAAFLMKQTNICGQCMFLNNVGGTVGGGVAFISSPIWHVCDGGRFQFFANEAGRGSAVFLHDIDARGNEFDNTSLHKVEFVRNNATVGGTVFWLYSESMHQDPDSFTNNNIVSWNDNFASYGITLATQAIRILGPKEYAVNVYGQSLTPALVYTLIDYHNQTIPLTGFTSLYVSIISSECDGRYAYLSGRDMFGPGVSMYNGSAVFNSLEAYCNPGGSLVLQFEARLGDLSDIPTTVAETYYITTQTTLTFRNCENGEYLKDGQCMMCSAGSYSLKYESSGECTDCSSTQGVEDCMSNQILLKDGYWRRFPTNAAVMACPMGTSSCRGSSGTGNAVCNEGYHGPLCSVCSDGYYPSQNTCRSCSGPSIISPLMIIYMLLFVVIVTIVAIVVYYRMQRDESLPEDARQSDAKDEEKSKWEVFYEWVRSNHGKITVKAKILIATYQIIVSSAKILDVNFTSGFSKFINVFDFINLSIANAFPLSCSRTFSFIDSLILTTLFPLALTALLWTSFVVEYAWVRQRIQANKHRQHGDKRRAFNAMKDKYLTFFFYLTYIVLPSVTTKIFEMFVCTNVDPDDEDDSDSDWYLSADMRISCSSSYYYGGVIYAVVMLFVYPVGVVALYFKLLHYHRNEIANRNATAVTTGTLSPHATRIGFLWEAYQPKYWYWEIVETVRRLLLTAVLSVCDPGSTLQSVIAIILSLIYVKLYSVCEPYSQASDNTMAEFGAYQIFTTFYIGQIILNKMLSEDLDILLDVVLVVGNCGMLLLVCYFGWKQRQSSKSSQSAECVVMSQKWDSDAIDVDGVELTTMSNPISTCKQGQSEESSKSDGV